MAKDFDLNSQKWLTLIFEGKNQEYGAYVHRDESSDRHLKALFIVSIIALCMIFLPSIIKSVLPAKEDLGQKEELKMAILDLDNEVPDENQIKEIEVPPPPELKTTVQFTAPVVTKEEIQEEQMMITQQELTEIKAEISISTVEGSDDGINIADFADQKVIVEEPTKPEIFVHVEQMPEFPGGPSALMKWLQDNMTYPPIAAEQGIQGRVSLKFVVTSDGSIDDVQVVKGLDPSCDREAVRVVKKMPKWIPGKQNGNPVYVYYNLPVVFRLQSSN